MSPQDSKGLSFALPLITVLFLVQEATGPVQTIIAVLAAIATTAFVFFAAQFVWSPLFKKIGFWWSSAFLGGAIIAVGLIAAIAGGALHVTVSAWRLPLSAAMMGLLFSWAFAALRGATKKMPNHSSQPSPRRG